MKTKITIIGAGNVGASLAYLLALKGIADIVLVDVLESVKGKALDIKQALPIFNFDINVIGTTGYEETKDSDIIVITAGLPRKPGMTREDLLKVNAEIISSVAEKIKKLSPEAMIIVVTNPLDIMAYLAKKVSGFNKNKVMGMAGTLDSSRMRMFIAEELNASLNEVEAIVLGAHGDLMVPVASSARVNGKPLSELLPKERIDKIIERTRNAGSEIINFTGTGSYYAPATAIYELIEAIIFDKKRILPCSAYLEGEYNVKGIFFGVPARIGKNGVEEIVELKLSEQEKEQLAKASDAIKESIKELKQV